MKNIDVNEYKKDMITEDYVSFEVAKLLKEKGFDSKCHSYYYPYHLLDGSIEYDKYDHTETKNNSWYDMYSLKTLPKDHYLAPTHQMAMKWLREKYNIFLNVGFGADDTGDFLFMTDIYDLTNDAIDGRYIPIVNADDYLTENPKSYEEAVEAALKYCLKNLI